MAELERLANHFGDIGAICNDASFSLMHAQSGILRERTLRAAEACFGHRLMMDVIVPGGVARDIAPRRHRRRCAHCSRKSARCFPRLIELYDNTASLQDRTVTTGIVKPELRGSSAPAAMSAAPRAATSTRAARSATRLTMSLHFEVPVLDAGDVNARVWIRIREVEQSLALIDQILERLPAGAITAPLKSGGKVCEGLGLVGSLSRRRAGLAAARRRRPGRRAAICAMRPGSNGRCWKPRSRATSSPTSRSATNRSIARIRGTTL